jgi:hypothetical protein
MSFLVGTWGVPLLTTIEGFHDFTFFKYLSIVLVIGIFNFMRRFFFNLVSISTHLGMSLKNNQNECMQKINLWVLVGSKAFCKTSSKDVPNSFKESMES